MAILFSKVTMRDDYNESEFFVSGFPQEPDDLEGWTAYHEFLDEITEDTIVNIHAAAYLYGEGETVKATPEEVAYMTIRDQNDPNFLSGHCDCIGESEFNVEKAQGMMKELGYNENNKHQSNHEGKV